MIPKIWPQDIAAKPAAVSLILGVVLVALATEGDLHAPLTWGPAILTIAGMLLAIVGFFPLLFKGLQAAGFGVPSNPEEEDKGD